MWKRKKAQAVLYAKTLTLAGYLTKFVALDNLGVTKNHRASAAIHSVAEWLGTTKGSTQWTTARLLYQRFSLYPPR